MAFSKNRDVIGWLLAGLFFGPFGLVVLFLPKIDRTVLVEKQLNNLEFYVKHGPALKYIIAKLSLKNSEVEQACLRLLKENKITENECNTVLGGIPISRQTNNFTKRL